MSQTQASALSLCWVDHQYIASLIKKFNGFVLCRVTCLWYEVCTYLKFYVAASYTGTYEMTVLCVAISGRYKQSNKLHSDEPGKHTIALHLYSSLAVKKGKWNGCHQSSYVANSPTYLTIAGYFLQCSSCLARSSWHDLRINGGDWNHSFKTETEKLWPFELFRQRKEIKIN